MTELNDPWTIELDPAVIGPGTHTLSVEARYVDGVVLRNELNFLGPPTWTDDIEPIHLAHCTGCHGAANLAHTMDDVEAWRFEIIAIIDDVETGRMPYGAPMLSPGKIELIRVWRDTGMLE